MKLLIVTQAVDRTDPVLGFFHRWIEEFAKHAESVTVICLRKGEYELPDNVQVYSLGKEKGVRPTLFYALRFWILVWRLRSRYTHVFVHMNPEYLLIAGLLWRALGKRVALWYMHKTVSWRLRLGILWSHVVYTASPRSMRVVTAKKCVVGHGIILGAAQLAPSYPPLSLLSVGRLSPIKRTHLLIDALQILVEEGTNAHLTIVGGAAGNMDDRYVEELRGKVEAYSLTNRVTFTGPKPHSALPELFARTHIFLHASDTGSLDKAVLEPLAAGVPVITVDSELADSHLQAVRLVEPNAKAFARVIDEVHTARIWDDQAIRSEARAYIEHHHELSRLITRILADSRFTRHR
jgi:glycosyltransferase involved in cell wall biosynthesis